MVGVEKRDESENGRGGLNDTQLVTLSGLMHLIYTMPREGTDDAMAALPSVRWLAQSLSKED